MMTSLPSAMAGYTDRKKCFFLLLVLIVGLGYFALCRYDSKGVMLSSLLAYGNRGKNGTRSYQHSTKLAHDVVHEPAHQKFITNDGLHFDKYAAIEYTDDDDAEIVTGDKIRIDVKLDRIRALLQRENGNCLDIQKNSYGYWRSTFTSGNFTLDLDARRLKNVVSCGGNLLSDFLRTPVRRQLYPFEVSYLSSPPVHDPSRISSAKTSWIKLVNSTTSFTVGDTVAFRIDVRDAAGRQKSRGGDRLKVWVTDVKKQHGVYATLTDFDNGTYMASTVLPWAGKAIVSAVLAYPREYSRVIFYNYRVLKTFRIHLGGYSNSEANEGVPCSPLPLIPGHKDTELCNLTERNGSPWYCGRPVKQSLKCSDFQLISFVKTGIEPLATPTERSLLQNGHVYRRAFLKGQWKIELNVKQRKPKEERLPSPAIACNEISAQETWDQPWPTGYLYNMKWQPFVCNLPPETSQDCFKDTKILVLGDSNGRYMYDNIQERSNCTKVIAAKWKKWHDILLCTTEKDNFSMSYMSHGSPFQSGKYRFVKYSILRPSSFVLDSIPSTGRYLIYINHYLHFVSYHSSVYEEQLMTLVEPIRRLLDRNPDAHILLRAPHVAVFTDTINPRGDQPAMVYYAIQRKVFGTVQDRLFYLPTWDITVAAGGDDPHPVINPLIYKTMLGYLCGRKPRKS